MMALLVAFPDAVFRVDHLYWPGNDDELFRVAVRWTLQGTHYGHGLYSDPSGKRVNIMSISPCHIKNGKFVEARRVFDEIALLNHSTHHRSVTGQMMTCRFRALQIRGWGHNSH